MYQKQSVILLDDPLSAVDRFVAKTMWTDCIQGLLEGLGRKLPSTLMLEVLNLTKTQLYYLPRIN